MSTVKRVLGSYTIQTINSSDPINLNSASVFVNGNLYVTGNSQQVVTTNSAVSDNIITLNHGVTVPNPAGAAIEVDRGTSANVQLRWNETTATWQVSAADGVTFSNIATASSTLANIFADPSPAISANLNITNHQLYDTVANVHIYANTVAGGGSGVYVDANGSNHQELVTKSKALAFSIIFG
jgi:hypothetical protein